MAVARPLEALQRPRLGRGTRLRFDPPSQSYVLLSPERGLRLNSSAMEIVQRCTGEFTVQQIVAALVASRAPNDPASAEQIEDDVLSLLQVLMQRKLLVSEASP